MNIVDVIIILLLLFGAVRGFKNGFTRQLVSFLGILVVTALAFYLKNYVSVFLYEHLPFFKFGGIFKGVTVLNIALYEVIAFLIVFNLLLIVLRILLTFTSIFEKILKFTIILGIPSKILGAIVGVVEAFIFVFIGLYICSLPFFTGDILRDSKYAGKILNSTPILSNSISKTMDVFKEFENLRDKYEVAEDAGEFNLETLDLFLKYKVITIESAESLIAKGKLDIPNVDSVLNKYRVTTS